MGSGRAYELEKSLSVGLSFMGYRLIMHHDWRKIGIPPTIRAGASSRRLNE